MRTNSSSWGFSLLAWMMTCAWAVFFLALEIVDGPLAGLELVVDVVRDERHFLDDLLLIIKLGESALQLVVELAVLGLESFLRPRFDSCHAPMLVHLLVIARL